MNNSVPVFNLTPSSSYTCRVGPAGAPTGELSWNATTRVLTVFGTIFIDGSVKLNNGLLNSYNGQSTIYLAGTVYMNNNTKLCGGTFGSNCDFASWNPNTEMLTFVAGGSGGLAGTGSGSVGGISVALVALERSMDGPDAQDAEQRARRPDRCVGDAPLLVERWPRPSLPPRAPQCPLDGVDRVPDHVREAAQRRAVEQRSPPRQLDRAQVHARERLVPACIPGRAAARVREAEQADHGRAHAAQRDNGPVAALGGAGRISHAGFAGRACRSAQIRSRRSSIASSDGRSTT